MNDIIDFYCLNYKNNQKRRTRIEELGEYFKINIQFYEGVEENNYRISKSIDKRTASICYGHLDMMKHFVDNSEKDFAIIMEDDIIIHKNFIDDLTKLLDVVITEKYDICLLGYLCHNPIHTYSNYHQLPTKYSNDSFIIFDNYPKDAWGTQMYLITKSQCEFLLDKYYSDYLERTLVDNSLSPFAADWTITKEGKRCLLYPPRVVEQYIENQYTDKGQELCRYNCSIFINKDDFM